MRTHDPVQLSRQGADAGTLYRSVILYHDDRQRKLAEEALNFIQNDSYRKVVTELVLFEKFYEGEDYHQNYHAQNPDKIFCKLVVDPKIQKLKKDFKKYLK